MRRRAGRWRWLAGVSVLVIAGVAGATAGTASAHHTDAEVCLGPQNCISGGELPRIAPIVGPGKPACFPVKLAGEEPIVIPLDDGSVTVCEPYPSHRILRGEIGDRSIVYAEGPDSLFADVDGISARVSSDAHPPLPPGSGASR